MLHSKRSLKAYYFFILFLSLVLPFLFSIGILSFLVINSNKRIDLANKQLKRSIELELVDSLYKYQNTIQSILQSEELKFLLNSTIDNESNYRKKLSELILLKTSELDFKRSDWNIFNSRGKLVYSSKKNERFIEKINDLILKDNGYLFLDNKKQTINFIIPINYYIQKNSIKNNGFVFVDISIEEIKSKFPEIINIHKIGNEIDISNLSIETNLSYQKRTSNLILYIYSCIILLFIIVCSLFGYKIFKKNIINKILSLKIRIRNEIDKNYNSDVKNELESLSLIFDYYLRYSKFLQNHLLLNSKLSAAGNLAHFIAHDLRKPFSKLRYFVGEVKNFSSLIKLRNFINEFEVSLLDSIDYVDHFLNEIMEASIEKVENVQLVPIEDIILGALSQISFGNREVNINFQYKTDDNLVLQVSRQRIIRVFINLLSNAYEAMNYNGNIWILSKEKVFNEKLFLEISIGNSNSLIPANLIDKIFEPFFTLNKKNGTGLGLAIVQKIINLHGGNIKCFNIPNKGVEFVFYLPAEKMHYSSNTFHLPNSFKLESSKYQNLQFDSDFEMKKSIIILDDDPLIIRSWKRSLKNVNTISFLYPEELLEYFYKHPKMFSDEIDFIISDYYFGNNSNLSFKDFVSDLRNLFQGIIFLSTDSENIETALLDKYQIVKIEKKIYGYDQLVAIKKKLK
ncbi:HAMP domain-containing sensor histidine kinase [Pigmentibacter sp. JX0631]|uniref:sensor histidine kinase n=1 Tax=Pigmentibacter sp. JX0631 TaxID=2976982 RepID=UPI0024698588|nr:HAMP domain-containing sensor histidine kinase [Pigmentibacter sp. JX0631]WGL58878.1 HAMP domain-containing sensor histidine kinase [Pigmentibacter sp. JX0631]